MQCLSKHSHGVLHRVLRFIELSLYLPFNIYVVWNIIIEPSPFSLGRHLAMDKISFYTFDEVRNIYSVPLVVWLDSLLKLIMLEKGQHRGHENISACAYKHMHFKLFP